jgi:hypothetical protein
MSPTIASPIKVITIDHTRSLDPDIVHGMPHWREGEACYGDPAIRRANDSVTAEIDALLLDSHGEGSNEPSLLAARPSPDTAQGGATGAP